MGKGRLIKGGGNWLTGSVRTHVSNGQSILPGAGDLTSAGGGNIGKSNPKFSIPQVFLAPASCEVEFRVIALFFCMCVE